MSLSNTLLMKLMCITVMPVVVDIASYNVTVHADEPHTQWRDVSAKDALIRNLNRLNDMESIDITVTVSSGWYGGTDPRVQKFRLVRDGSRWARYQIPPEPRPGPPNYDITRPDGSFILGMSPRGAGHSYGMEITDPQPLENTSQVGTLSHNLGSFWYPTTREYIRNHAHRARIVGQEVIEGYDNIVIEIDVASSEVFEAFKAIMDRRLLDEGAVLRVYVAPDLGFAIPRYEGRSIDGKPDHIVQSSGFHEYNGIYFPSEGLLEGLDRLDDGSVNPVSFRKIEVTEVASINRPIPDSEFTVVIPEDTGVGDYRGGRAVSVLVDQENLLAPSQDVDAWIEREVDRLRQPVGGETWPRLGTVLVLANLAIFLAAVVLLVARYRRKGQNYVAN